MAMKEAQSGSCMSMRSSKETLSDLQTVVDLDPETILPKIRRIPAKNLYKGSQKHSIANNIETGRTSM